MDYDLWDLSLQKNAERKAYSKIPLKNVKWVERSSLMANIEFFTLYAVNDKAVCVIVNSGASNAAGVTGSSAVNFLSEMFLQIDFHVYTGNGTIALESNAEKAFSSAITVHNRAFTDEDAAKYREKIDNEEIVYFITTDAESTSDAFGGGNEEANWAFMQKQENWVKIINPTQSSLYFRLPYPTDNSVNAATSVYGSSVEYLDGTIYFPIWNGGTSSETRLVPNREFTSKKWDLVEYEEKLFYHNAERRQKFTYHNIFTDSVAAYGGGVGGSGELLNDYDSTTEVFILTLFLYKIYQKIDVVTYPEKVMLLSNKITKALNMKNKIPVTIKSLRPRKIDTLFTAKVNINKMGTSATTLKSTIQPKVSISASTVPSVPAVPAVPAVPSITAKKMGGLKISSGGVATGNTTTKRDEITSTGEGVATGGNGAIGNAEGIEKATILDTEKEVGKTIIKRKPIMIPKKK